MKNIRQRAVGKVGLVGLLLIFVLPFAVVVYQLISEIDVGINFTQKERLGIKYNDSLRKLLEDVVEYRRLVSAYLSGNTALKKKVVLKRSQIEDDIRATDAVDRHLGLTLKTSEQWLALKQKWQVLRGKEFMSPQASFEAHTALIADILSSIAHVGDTSNLILDPVLDSYYLMDAVVTKLPPAIEQTARARDLSVEMMADNSMAAAEKAQLTILASLIKSPNDATRRGIQVAFGYNPSLNPQLKTTARQNFATTSQFVEAIERQAVSPENVKLQPSFVAGTKAIAAQFQLFDVTSPILDGLLQARLNESYRKKYFVEVFALLVLATVIFVLLAFARSLTKRQQAEEEVRLLETIAHTTSEAQDFHAALKLALYKVCEATGWSYGEAWVPQPDGSVLECSPAWYGSTQLEQFRRSGEALKIALGAGLPGRVWLSQRSEWVQDVSLQSNAEFLRVQMATAAGLKAALGVPIIANVNANGDSEQREELQPQPSQVLAVLLFFMLEFHKEDKRLVEIVSAIAAQLGSVLQRKRAEVALQESLSQLAKANQEITSLNERLEAENVRMQAELDVTRRLQQMILPKERELSQIDGLEIAGFMEPAEEVGGDYYDVLRHNGSVKIGIGDVTGHGIESGVLMIMVQTAVRTLLSIDETDPIKFLNVLNQTIYGNVQRMNSDKNLTLSLLDYKEGLLRLSGQHEEMIVVRASCLRPGSSPVVERVDTIDLGFPIGLEADITDFIAEVRVQLNPGDVVVLYTDGITEAENLRGEQYGLEQLCQIASRNWQASAKEIREAVIDDVRQHIGKQRIYDDITLLVFKQK